MKCKPCDSPTEVVDSREGNAHVRRRRECRKCGRRFTTHEYQEEDDIVMKLQKHLKKIKVVVNRPIIPKRKDSR